VQELAQTLREHAPDLAQEARLYLLTPASPLLTSWPFESKTLQETETWELPEAWDDELRRILDIDSHLTTWAVWVGKLPNGELARSAPLRIELRNAK
jgi:hypothetical protein